LNAGVGEVYLAPCQVHHASLFIPFFGHYEINQFLNSGKEPLEMKQATIIPQDPSTEKKWCAQAVVACTEFEIEEMLTRVLREFGIHPIVSDSLEEIGALLAEEETVVAFSQTNLPVGSFQKVLSAAETRASKVPVVVCSEAYNEDLYIDVMSMGAFEYLAFPCDREEVEWVVNNAIKWGPLLGGTQGHRAGLVSLHGAS